MNSPDADAFVGTWSLASYEARTAGDQIDYPFGRELVGQLMYDSVGNMSAHVMQPNRPAFAAGDIWGGTDAEVRAAFEGSISYFGRYEVDEDAGQVIHRVRGASFPNWVGGDQLRYYEFSGGTLSLSTPPITSGGEDLRFVLVWRRGD